MRIPNLTEATIQVHTEEGSFSRGEAYAQQGKVLQVEQQSEYEIEAQVQGSQLVPYTVTIRYDDGGVTKANCTCPYHGGSWCKHIAATLLTCLERDDAEVDETVRAHLSGLTRDELVNLIERLAIREPRVAEWVEKEVPARKASE